MSGIKNSKIIDLRQEFKQQIDDLIPTDDYMAKAAELYNAGLGIGEDGSLIYSVYVGSQLSIYPSGKIYAPWTSNQTWRDVVLDVYFDEMLTARLDELGLYHHCESGDVWICQYYGDDFYSTEDGKTFFQYGQQVANSEEQLAQHMTNANFFPDVISVSDHGNVSMYQWEIPFDDYHSILRGA